MATPELQGSLASIETAFRENAAYGLPGAGELAGEAARELVYRTVSYVVTEDPVRPKFLWTYNAAREESGRRIPGTTFIESVDSLYRTVTLGKGYHYQVSGRIPENRAAYITFEVWNAAQGLNPKVAYVAHLQADRMDIAGDGSFVVSIGPEANDENQNHLQLPEGGWLILRESMADWSTQRPIENLEVTLLDEVDRPEPAFDELVARAVAVMPMSLAVYETYLHSMFSEDDSQLYIAFGNRLNSLRPKVPARGGDWGAVTGTMYDIPEDKALVVNIKSADADYFAIQLHDAWGRTLDPVYLTNRNKGLSALNPDGSVTYVLSQRDPGVANWLDTRGLQSGSLIIRWQGLDLPGGTQAELVHGAQLVSLDRLDSVLPATMARVDARQRQRELDVRKAAYGLRLR